MPEKPKKNNTIQIDKHILVIGGTIAAIIIVIVIAVIILILRKNDASDTGVSTTDEFAEISERYHAHCDDTWGQNICNTILTRLKAKYSVEELRNGQKENGDFSYFELPDFSRIEHCSIWHDKPSDPNSTECDEFKSNSSSSSSGSNTSDSYNNSNSSSESKNNTAPSSNSSSSSSSSSEWKQFLKDYEAWIDDYVAFMKKYKNASSSDLPAMMNDYTNMMTKVTEWSDKASKIQSKLSGSDLTEYLQTLNRIVQKMSEV